MCWVCLTDWSVFEARQSCGDIAKLLLSPDRSLFEPFLIWSWDNEQRESSPTPFCRTRTSKFKALNHLMTKGKRHHPIRLCGGALIQNHGLVPFRRRSGLKLLPAGMRQLSSQRVTNLITLKRPHFKPRQAPNTGDLVLVQTLKCKI